MFKKKIIFLLFIFQTFCLFGITDLVEYCWDNNGWKEKRVTFNSIEELENGLIKEFAQQTFNKGIHNLSYRIVASSFQSNIVEKRIYLFKGLDAESNLKKLVRAQYRWDDGDTIDVLSFDGHLEEAIEEFVFQDILEKLESGIHVFGLRVQDSEQNWSSFTDRMIYVREAITTPDTKKLVRAQYRWDDGDTIEVLSIDGHLEEAIEEFVFLDILEKLESGIHVFGLRVQDSEQNWSSFTDRMIYVREAMTTPDTKKLVRAQYRWDDGDTIDVLSIDGDLEEAIEEFVFQDILEKLEAGIHVFGLRVQDSEQNWSSFTDRMIYVREAITTPDTKKLVRAQYRWDDGDTIDVLSFDGHLDEAIEEFVFQDILEKLESGIHVFGLRVQDSEQNWSSFTDRMIYVREVITTPGTKKLVRAQYRWDGGHPIEIMSTDLNESINFFLNQDVENDLDIGHHLFELRVLDQSAKWTPYLGRMVYVDDCVKPDLNLGDSIEVCEGTSHSMKREGYDTYEWYNENDSLLSEVDSVTVSDVEKLTLLVDKGTGCEQEDSVFFKINLKPIANFELLQDRNQIEIRNQSQYADLFYWSYGDETFSNLMNPPVHEYDETGEFTVKLIVSNECGVDSLSKEVLILLISLSDPYSANDEIHVYPNPGETFQLKLDENSSKQFSDLRLNLYDTQGKRLASDLKVDDSGYIFGDIPLLDRGYYFIEIIDQENRYLLKWARL